MDETYQVTNTMLWLQS